MNEVKDLVEDAEHLVEKAVEEMEVDLRDAAEKAWGATVRAIDALILARVGVKPEIARERRMRLGEIVVKEKDVDEAKIWERYHSRAQALHAECFYGGVCKPVDVLKKKILETRDLVEDVKQLVS